MGRQTMYRMENNTKNLTGGMNMYVMQDNIYEDSEGNLYTESYMLRSGGYFTMGEETPIWHTPNGGICKVKLNKEIKKHFLTSNKTIRCNYDQLFTENDNIILCNNIEKYVDLSCIENGNLYYEEDGEECQHEIYQFFIIDDQLADTLSRHTNEIIMYSEDLDVYVLGVTHFGTSWSYVRAEYIINKNKENN